MRRRYRIRCQGAIHVAELIGCQVVFEAHPDALAESDTMLAFQALGGAVTELPLCLYLARVIATGTFSAWTPGDDDSRRLLAALRGQRAAVALRAFPSTRRTERK